jgi:hypothetical protein
MADAAHGLRRLADAHAGDRTRESAVGPAAAVVPLPAPEPDPEPSYADDDHDYSRPAYAAPARSRKPGYAVLAAVALLLVLGGVAYAASLRGEDPSPSDSAGATSSTADTTPKNTPKQSPSTKASTQPSPSPSPTRQSTTPSPSPSAASGSGLAARRAFLRDYFAQAPGGTDAAWAMLTPGYQDQVTRGSYDGFWRTISSVSVSNVTDAGGGAVEATLAYTKTDGGTSTERHRLELVRSGGGFLIDGDAPA